MRSRDLPGYKPRLPAYDVARMTSHLATFFSLHSLKCGCRRALYHNVFELLSCYTIETIALCGVFSEDFHTSSHEEYCTATFGWRFEAAWGVHVIQVGRVQPRFSLRSTEQRSSDPTFRPQTIAEKRHRADPQFWAFDFRQQFSTWEI